MILSNNHKINPNQGQAMVRFCCQFFSPRSLRRPLYFTAPLWIGSDQWKQVCPWSTSSTVCSFTSNRCLPSFIHLFLSSLSVCLCLTHKEAGAQGICCQWNQHKHYAWRENTHKRADETVNPEIQKNPSNIGNHFYRDILNHFTDFLYDRLQFDAFIQFNIYNWSH